MTSMRWQSGGAIGFFRVVLAVVALWLLHVAVDRYGIFHIRYVRTFGATVDMWSWLLWTGTAAVAGFVFGIAAWFPFAAVRYRWSRLMLAAIVVLPLAHFWVVLGYLARRHPVGGWLAHDWFWDFASQTALALLVGVAVASGFVAKPPPKQTDVAAR
jgi:hypothetical protein